MSKQMTQLHSEESSGTYGAFGIAINVSATDLPDLRSDIIMTAAYNAARLIKSAVMGEVVAGNAEAQKQRLNEREQIISLFKEPIYVEEIPNGYCSEWCCKHLPWFIVTTGVGRFKIGWRKRVIEIDWTETTGTKAAEELFPSENVTKGKRSIHAWSSEDATRYIATIATKQP